MEYTFSLDEIFEMAKQIEVNGAAFYRKAAEKTDKKEEKQFLLSLAAMEDTHKNTFAAMQAEFNKAAPLHSLDDPQGDAVLYLKAMADTKVFFKKEAPGSQLNEILKSAIEAEKDSILFYLGMKEMIEDGDDKKRIDGIIREEMGHITILSKEMTRISG